MVLAVIETMAMLWFNLYIIMSVMVLVCIKSITNYGLAYVENYVYFMGAGIAQSV
jgi:hypothetical protein